MPNHVINEVILHGVPLERSSPLLIDATGSVSFGILCPLPLHFWPGSVGIEHEKAFPGTHLDAARATWGTKWDAYGGPSAVDVGGSTVVTFQSAWSPPRGWICALFNTLKCNITAKWLSEGGGESVEEIFVWDGKESLGGPAWEQINLSLDSHEHRRLHKLLWGVEEFISDDKDPQP